MTDELGQRRWGKDELPSSPHWEPGHNRRGMVGGPAWDGVYMREHEQRVIGVFSKFHF